MTYTRYVIASSLNIRKTASTSGTKVGSYKREQVEVPQRVYIYHLQRIVLSIVSEEL